LSWLAREERDRDIDFLGREALKKFRQTADLDEPTIHL
jgi:hypothetical protein